jgi:hypothetical protein
VNIRSDDGQVTCALLADRSLVHPWVPLSCDPAEAGAPPHAVVAVEPMQSPTPASGQLGPPTLRIGPVGAWLEAGSANPVLRGTTAGWGRIDLTTLHSTLWADLEAGEAAGADLYAMLTIASALLLGRMSRALIHAGAVVAPDGRGWLVVGDARSGKSTACVSLASTGCGLLSDDQVVLTLNGRRLEVEGWLRPVHLDEGWDEGIPRGRRRTTHPSELGGGTTRRVVPLAGTVHTSVDAAQPTRVSEIPAGDAFTGLVRQSPWLLADRVVARSLVDMLSGVAQLPRFALRLGLDTFGRSDRLHTLLTPALF